MDLTSCKSPTDPTATESPIPNSSMSDSGSAAPAGYIPSPCDSDSSSIASPPNGSSISAALDMPSPQNGSSSSTSANTSSKSETDRQTPPATYEWVIPCMRHVLFVNTNAPTSDLWILLHVNHQRIPQHHGMLCPCIYPQRYRKLFGRARFPSKWLKIFWTSYRVLSLPGSNHKRDSETRRGHH